MSILEIARLGHPRLREPSLPVSLEKLVSPETQQLIDDLIETMRASQGAGLAAPQVGVLERIVVLEVHANSRYPEAPEIPLAVLVNPTLQPVSPRRMFVWEGCLSVPGLRGQVLRCEKVQLEALDRRGQPLSLQAEGFHAAVLQHECDHLHGKLFIDRVEDTTTLSFSEELARHRPGEPLLTPE